MAVIHFIRQLVYQIPSNITITAIDNPNYVIRPLSLEDIDNDEWLRKDRKSLIKLVKKGHLGIVIFDKENQKVAARSFIALYGKRLSHIPRTPKNSAWLHYASVKDEYRGHGLQNNLTMFAVQMILKINDRIEIYTDTGEGNIPSRINQRKLGLIECGVYTVLKIGTQRFPLCSVQLGFWNKKIKHPELSIGSLKNNRNISIPKNNDSHT